MTFEVIKEFPRGKEFSLKKRANQVGYLAFNIEKGILYVGRCNEDVNIKQAFWRVLKTKKNEVTVNEWLIFRIAPTYWYAPKLTYSVLEKVIEKLLISLINGDNDNGYYLYELLVTKELTFYTSNKKLQKEFKEFIEVYSQKVYNMSKYHLPIIVDNFNENLKEFNKNLNEREGK